MISKNNDLVILQIGKYKQDITINFYKFYTLCFTHLFEKHFYSAGFSPKSYFWNPQPHKLT